MRTVTIAFLVLLTQTCIARAERTHAGTAQEQQACTRDASRLCRSLLGNDGAVQNCLQQNRARLSRGCRAVFEAHGM
jgi:hypothetical protein